MRAESHLFHRMGAAPLPRAVRAEGVFIYDEQGHRYLDGCSGALVANLGHGREEVVRAMAEQAARLAYVHGGAFTTEPAETLARLVAELAPGDLNRVFLVSGGSEATETALKMARQFWVEQGRPEKYLVISRWLSYHGATLGALAMSGHAARRRPYRPLLADFPHIPPCYHYRCPLCQHEADCNLRCAYALEEEILRVGPEYVAAFIAEPVVGAAAGATTPPPGYFELIRQVCDRYDVLFIADEVMTGFGRTGCMFGIQHWEAVPDIVAAGKGISAGYAPLGAVIAREEIYRAIEAGSGGFVHGFTYSGHPPSAAAGVAVLTILREEGLVEAAAGKGEYLRAGLLRVQERHPMVGDVRGKGLMLGLEFVRDRTTKEPFPRELKVSERVVAAAFRRGLCVYPGSGTVDGVRGDHILVGPPLTIGEAELDLLVAILDEALTEVEAQVLG
jgi:adenosylmethionine-8-amino-7-oxononanoate aminotransferase